MGENRKRKAKAQMEREAKKRRKKSEAQGRKTKAQMERKAKKGEARERGPRARNKGERQGRKAKAFAGLTPGERKNRNPQRKRANEIIVPYLEKIIQDRGLPDCRVGTGASRLNSLRERRRARRP
jgi:hypothetical protein